MDFTPDDDMTELTDADIPRVDLVGSPANGSPGWLVMKQDESAGLLDPAFVRDLIAKSDPAPAPEETVTVTGSPAAMAALIHGASVRKAKYDAADLRRMAASGAAMKDESYPIADRADLERAIHAVGRGGSSHDAIRRHIITRARSLGASSLIPDNWNADGSLKSGVSKEAPVAKDMMDAAGDATVLDDGIDGLDPTVPLAAPDDMGPGDPADPGSPAWESIDAATAQKWTSILARAKVALGVMAEREMLEAASADPDDAGNAMDLDGASCAIDYAIGILAPFAVSEQSEADTGAMEMDAIGKALAGFDAAPLGVIEGLSAVAKAGRVLSAANEAKLRDAAKGIGDVLASLPSAPQAETAVQKKGAAMPATTITAPVSKADDGDGDGDGTAVSAGTTGLGEPRETGPAAALPADGPQEPEPGDTGRTVVKSSLVPVYDQARRLVGVTAPASVVTRLAKAASDAPAPKVPMQAVFDADGTLVGIVDPSDITPVSGAGKAAGDDGDGDTPDADADAPAADDAAPAADGSAAPAADPGDMTPQPPADAGTPADAVGKAAGQNVITVPQDQLGAIIAKAVAEALGAVTPAQDVAKMADVAGALAEVETLKARLAVVEEHPAAPKVFTNGQVPPAHMLRGQDQGGIPQIDVAKAMDRKRELYRSPDSARQNEVAQEMNGDALAAITALHAQR